MELLKNSRTRHGGPTQLATERERPRAREANIRQRDTGGKKEIERELEIEP